MSCRFPFFVNLQTIYVCYITSFCDRPIPIFFRGVSLISFLFFQCSTRREQKLLRPITKKNIPISNIVYPLSFKLVCVNVDCCTHITALIAHLSVQRYCTPPVTFRTLERTKIKMGQSNGYPFCLVIADTSLKSMLFNVIWPSVFDVTLGHKEHSKCKGFKSNERLFFFFCFSRKWFSFFCVCV